VVSGDALDRRATTMSGHPAVGIALLAAGLFLSVHPAWAQSGAAIRGQVIAAADESGIEGAVIVLASSAGTPVEVRAETAGRFAITTVVPGDYTLSVAAQGFASRRLRLSIEPREVRTVIISLEIAGVAVAVEVAGDRMTSPSVHSPSSTTLTLERLDAMPLFQRVTLPDAVVRLAPGMIRGHDDFVHIRGHEVALNPLINGVSFWENTHSVFSAGLSPDVIDTANIMTGGFPAEFGNRFGGVVDVVTRSGLRMQNRGSATIALGSAGRRRAAADIGGRRGRFGYFLSGGGFLSARYLSPPAPIAMHDAAHGGHAFGQTDVAIGRGLLRAVVLGDAIDLEIPRSADDIALRPLAMVRQRARQESVITSWIGMMGDVSITASAYQRLSQVRLFPAEGPLTVRAAGVRRLSTLGAKLDGSRLIGRHAIKAGVDAVRLAPRETLSYAYDGYLEYTHLIGLPHVHVSLQHVAFSGADAGGQVSAYVQDSVQLGHATIDAGLRLDAYRLIVSRTHLSPRVNVALRISDGTIVHASYNHFFVPPPVEGVLSNSAGLTRFIDEIGIALPPVAPTLEHQYEGGVTTRVGPLDAAITGYHRVTSNPIHTTIWPDSRVYSYASFHRARASGVEGKLEAKSLLASGVAGFLNYALGRVRFQNPVTGGFVTEAGHLADTNRFLAPMDQTHTLTGGATYRHAAAGLWLSGAIEYGSGTPMGHGAAHDHGDGAGVLGHPAPAADPARVPGHFTADASFGVDLLRAASRRSTLTLQLDLENIADNVYVIAQEGEFSPSQFSHPRLFSVTARWRF
jgi:hypothetical protein